MVLHGIPRSRDLHYSELKAAANAIASRIVTPNYRRNGQKTTQQLRKIRVYSSKQRRQDTRDM